MSYQDDTPKAQRPKRPIDTIPDGNVKASIWRNESDRGAHFSTTFSNNFKDASGNWHNTESFSGTDLLKVSELAREAYAREKNFRRQEFEKRRTQQTQTPNRTPDREP